MNMEVLEVGLPGEHRIYFPEGERFYAVLHGGPDQRVNNRKMEEIEKLLATSLEDFALSRSEKKVPPCPFKKSLRHSSLLKHYLV
jgi:hypothetical protein